MKHWNVSISIAVSGRPGRKAGARIETLWKSTELYASGVAPVARPGRGLKQVLAVSYRQVTLSPRSQGRGAD